jgi:TorA maturation chaperone TorD
VTAAVRDQAAVLEAMARAAVYEALGLAFAHPEPESRRRLGDLLHELVAAQPPAPPGLADMTAELAAASGGQLGTEFTRLFDTAVPCSPYETDYQSDPFAKAAQLADIAGFFAAWGVEVARARPTTADFIGSECEFMSLLARKEAYALNRGWADKAEITRAAQTSFLRDHLGRWVAKFATDVAAAAGQNRAGRFYTRAAAACRDFVEAEVHARGLAPIPLTRRMVGGIQPVACPQVEAAPGPTRPGLPSTSGTVSQC